MARVHLTRQAILQLDEIERYSVEQWGSDVAEQYVADLASALSRIEEHPGLLRSMESVSPRLRFYSVREHVLICDAVDEQILVLAVWHGSMDFAARLRILEPQFLEEVEILAERLRRH